MKLSNANISLIMQHIYTPVHYFICLWGNKGGGGVSGLGKWKLGGKLMWKVEIRG